MKTSTKKGQGNIYLKLTFFLIYLIFVISEMVSEDLGTLYRISVFLDIYKVKYVVSVLVIGLMLLGYLKSYKKRVRFGEETKCVLIATAVLSAITIIKQLINGLQLYSYNEIAFLLIPILFIFLLINQSETPLQDYLDIAFNVQYIFFLLNISRQLSFHNILTIDFWGSYSPYESEMSFYGLIFFLFYLSAKDKKRSILSFIMVFLSLKRMAVAFCICIWILSFLRKNFTKGQPKKIIVYTVTGIFIIVPLVFHLLCTPEFSEWFYRVTSLDFNEFISGRLERLTLCLNNEMKYGLGATTDFLNRTLQGNLSRNLHNDILRIYLECGIWGTIFFTFQYFKLASHCKMSFYLMIYLFTDMIFNHFIGAGRAAFWMIIYLTICCYNESERLSDKVFVRGGVSM